MEVAVLAPIIVLLLLATIDACTMIFLKQTLTTAAYEGGRTAVIPGTSAADITLDVQQILTERGVNDALIQITPNNPNSAHIGDPISVRVSAPCNTNALCPTGYFSNQQLVGEVKVMKEFD